MLILLELQLQKKPQKTETTIINILKMKPCSITKTFPKSLSLEVCKQIITLILYSCICTRSSALTKTATIILANCNSQL